jgi:hypothetical protein
MQTLGEEDTTAPQELQANLIDKRIVFRVSFVSSDLLLRMLAVGLPVNCRCRGVGRGTCVGVGSVNHLRVFDFLVAAAEAIVKIKFTASIATLGQVVAVEAKLAAAHACSKAFTAEPQQHHTFLQACPSSR